MSPQLSSGPTWATDKHLWTQRSRWSTQSSGKASRRGKKTTDFDRARSWEGLGVSNMSWTNEGDRGEGLDSSWFHELLTEEGLPSSNSRRWKPSGPHTLTMAMAERCVHNAFATPSSLKTILRRVNHGRVISCCATCNILAITNILSSGLKLIHWPPKIKVYPELPEFWVCSRNGGIPKFW